MDWVLFFVCLYIVLACLCAIRTASAPGSAHVRHRSTVDGREYLVQDAPDAARAADTLAHIRAGLVRLVQHLERTHPHAPAVQRIRARFDDGVLIENEDPDSQFTSYTHNKGERIVFCLRTRDNDNTLHENNLLMFVAIHELAHVASVSVGHDDPEFWDNFRFLLREAVAAGVWKYTDFAKTPAKYCGLRITNSII